MSKPKAMDIPVCLLSALRIVKVFKLRVRPKRRIVDSVPLQLCIFGVRTLPLHLRHVVYYGLPNAAYALM